MGEEGGGEGGMEGVVGKGGGRKVKWEGRWVSGEVHVGGGGGMLVSI